MPDTPSPTAHFAPPAADYSLRASGDTYLERDREAAKIIDRIKSSSSSVIGISGVRGAGKSSLAKKVLNESGAAQYFTLLIPSPTGYEPREFLLAIFQRIAEHASEQIQKVFDRTKTLADLGDEAARAVRRRSYMMLVGAVLLMSAVTGLASYIVYTEAAKIEKETTTLLGEKLQAIGLFIAQKNIVIDPTPSPVEFGSKKVIDELLDEKNIKVFEAKLARISPPELQFLRAVADHQYARRVHEAGTALNYKTISAYGGIFLSGALGWIVIFVVFRRLQKAGKYRKFNKQAGLERTSGDFLELVKYQKVLGSGSELSLPLKYFAGKLTRSQQLTDRPLSLPGLTAECSTFLQQVAEVFNGKVVICIDELDKITDVAALLELLKGIKGILGQENTHFLLTISEDAMAFFTERLNRERNLVESSFEDIVYLDRLTYDLSTRVVRQSLPATAEIPASFAEHSLVLWLFGAGIPREIKRNMILCSNEGKPITASSPRDVWRVLYRTKLNSMLVLNAPKPIEAQEHYRFLVCIEQIIDMLRDGAPLCGGVDFSRQVLSVIHDNFQPNFQQLTEQASLPRFARKTNGKNGRANGKNKDKHDEGESADPYLYLAQLMEVIIGTIILAIIDSATESKPQNYDQLKSLIYVYKFIPINPQYAFYVLDKFLNGNLKMIDVPLELLSRPKLPRNGSTHVTRERITA